MTIGTQDRKLRELFDQLTGMLGCNDRCEGGCVFPAIGTGPGCPVNQFREEVAGALDAGRSPDAPVRPRRTMGKVFVEGGVMFGGMYEARLARESGALVWQVRKLPSRPLDHAEVLSRHPTRTEAFHVLWSLVAEEAIRNTKPILEALADAGVPEDDIEEDGPIVCVKVSDASTRCVESHPLRSEVTMFPSGISGELWYEIPRA